jgi:thiamine-phosphate pyrophosphorylase
VLCFVASKAGVKNGDIEAAVKAAVDGGVTMVQLREPAMAAGELAQLAQRLKAITRGKALLLINDRVDVAMAVEADGVELPEAGLSTRWVRGTIGKYPVLGRSVHAADTAGEATREGADFVIAGTIYKSPSKPDAKPAGPALLSEITKDASIPVVAIGGVTAKNVDEVIKAGAAGVAVISAIGSADDPKAATEELATALREAWSSRPELALGA